MGRTSRQIRGACALALLGVLLRPAAARADGIGATAEVGYTNGTLTITDATGRSSTILSSLLPQRYRLSLDKTLYPFLILNATGLYQWTPGWTTTDGVETTTDNQRWNVFASLLVGPPILNATPYYLRRQEFGTVGAGGVSVRSPTLVNQAYGVYAGWTPAGLPLLNLQGGPQRELRRESRVPGHGLRRDHPQRQLPGGGEPGAPLHPALVEGERPARRRPDHRPEPGRPGELVRVVLPAAPRHLGELHRGLPDRHRGLLGQRHGEHPAVPGGRPLPRGGLPVHPFAEHAAPEPGPHRRGLARERRDRHRLRPFARRRPEPARHGRDLRERHDRGEHAPALGGPAASAHRRRQVRIHGLVERRQRLLDGDSRGGR